MFKNKPRMSEPDINELASKIESLDHQLDNLYEQITYSRTEVQYLLEIYQNHVIFPQHCESLKNTDMKILCQLLLDCQKLCDSILTIGTFFQRCKYFRIAPPHYNSALEKYNKQTRS